MFSFLGFVFKLGLACLVVCFLPTVWWLTHLGLLAYYPNYWALTLGPWVVIIVVLMGIKAFLVS